MKVPPLINTIPFVSGLFFGIILFVSKCDVSRSGIDMQECELSEVNASLLLPAELLQDIIPGKNNSSKRHVIIRMIMVKKIWMKQI